VTARALPVLCALAGPTVAHAAREKPLRFDLWGSGGHSDAIDHEPQGLVGIGQTATLRCGALAAGVTSELLVHFESDLSLGFGPLAGVSLPLGPLRFEAYAEGGVRNVIAHFTIFERSRGGNPWLLFWGARAGLSVPIVEDVFLGVWALYRRDVGTRTVEVEEENLLFDGTSTSSYEIGGDTFEFGLRFGIDLAWPGSE
jgi:hypothetical protein